MLHDYIFPETFSLINHFQQLKDTIITFSVSVTLII